jgi:hypothetical protein
MFSYPLIDVDGNVLGEITITNDRLIELIDNKIMFGFTNVYIPAENKFLSDVKIHE